MLVNEIMTKNVITIDSDSTVLEACKRYYRYKIGCLIVMEEGAMVGIVTERDIISRVIICQKDPDEVKIDEIMSKDVITIDPMAEGEEAARIMDKNNIKKLPVVSDNKVVGIITISDIMNIGPNYLKTLAEEGKVESY